MRPYFRLLTLGLLLTSVTSAQAAYEDSSYPTERTRLRAGKTSEMNREDKRWEATFQPIGFSVLPIPSMGLNAGYYLNPDLIIQLELSSGQSDLAVKSSSDTSSISSDITAKTVGVNAKYFTGNSFYFKGGLAYRQIGLKNLNYTSGVSTLSSSSASQTKISISDMGSVDSAAAELSIGNQWQWSTFTIGCDWLGVMVPLAVVKIDDRITTSGMSSADRKSLQDAWTTLGKATSVQIGRFYLGASF